MTTSHIDFSSWAAIGMLTAAVAAGWRQFLNIWRFLRGLLIVDVKLDAEANIAVTHYIRTTYRNRSYRGNRKIYSRTSYVRPRSRSQNVACEYLSMMVFWVGRVPCLVYFGGDSQRNESQPSGGTSGALHLMFFRGMVDIDDFIAKAMDAYADVRSGESGNAPQRFRIEYMAGSREREPEESSKAEPREARNIGSPHPTDSLSDLQSAFIYGYEWNDLLPPVVKTAVDDLALSDDAQDLVNHCERWLGAEAWFTRRRVPWKYGFCVYGEPGCGKTSLVRAIAQRLDLPIYVFDLATMTNRDLKNAWREMLCCVPCMPLFEDVDAVFNGRENVTGYKNGVTFDCLLNCIDGVQKSDGILLAVTTNHIDKIDPALGVPQRGDSTMSTRPGRVDRVIKVGKPDADGRRKIAQRILSDWPELVEESVQDGAQFQARCVIIAERMWREGKVSLENVPKIVRFNAPVSENYDKPVMLAGTESTRGFR